MPNAHRSTQVTPEIGSARERALSSLLRLRARLRATLPSEGDHEPEPVRAPAPASAPPDAEALLNFIGGEIIPRLMIAHQSAAHPIEEPALEIGPEIHRSFVEVVLDGSESQARRFVDDLLDRGVSLETIFLELLTNAARELGELWERDERSFGDVTIGLLRLHHVLRERRLDDTHHDHGGGGRARVLMTSAGGDQHVFGLLMVSEFFRKAGWSVCSEPGTTADQIEQMLRREPFDLLGVTASCSTLAEHVGDEFQRYRAASCNRDLKILVGGRLFVETPGLIERVGADAAASDPREAVRQADALLSRATVGG